MQYESARSTSRSTRGQHSTVCLIATVLFREAHVIAQRNKHPRAPFLPMTPNRARHTRQIPPPPSTQAWCRLQGYAHRRRNFSIVFVSLVVNMSCLVSRSKSIYYNSCGVAWVRHACGSSGSQQPAQSPKQVSPAAGHPRRSPNQVLAEEKGDHRTRAKTPEPVLTPLSSPL